MNGVRSSHAPEENSREPLVPAVAAKGFDRRTVLGWGAGAVAGMAGLTACAAGAATTASSSAAGGGWLAGLASDIGLGAGVDLATEAVHSIWSKWLPQIFDRMEDHKENTPYYSNQAYADATPPAVLIAMSKERDVQDAGSGHLLVCVNGARHAVLFKPWAWSAMGKFAHELTHGRSGADLARYQSLAVRGLVPSGLRPQRGTTPRKGAAWMTYRTHNGWVEIVRVTEAGGTKVTITASGIPDADHRPTRRTYDYDEPVPAAGA
jgi:hypothetical protein